MSCPQILQVTCQCIGLEIRLGHFPCFFISTYMMRSLSIGILNWIGVYPRSCIFSKISKLVSMYWIRNLIRSSLISFLNSE